MNLKYQIWNKSTNDLYDFESDDFIKGDHKIENDQYLVLTENNKIISFSESLKLSEYLNNNPNDKVIVDISALSSKNFIYFRWKIQYFKSILK